MPKIKCIISSCAMSATLFFSTINIQFCSKTGTYNTLRLENLDHKPILPATFLKKDQLVSINKLTASITFRIDLSIHLIWRRSHCDFNWNHLQYLWETGELVNVLSPSLNYQNQQDSEMDDTNPLNNVNRGRWCRLSLTTQLFMIKNWRVILISSLNQ